MTKKLFPLMLKDDVPIRTIEGLRENFDLEKILAYFKSGELLTWLEDRFYDDEAAAIENLDANDQNLAEKICAALNAEDNNLEFTQRTRQKKAILRELTDDAEIIDNAATTALNQEDLANLLNMDCKTIYLCGEQFNVPIRIAGVKYVGILGAPKIKIRAKSQDELDAQNISFENVHLPWQKISPPIEEIKALAEKIFQTGGKFPIVSGGKKISTFDQLGKDEKSAALRMVCQGKYSESQVAFMQITDDFSSGFAFTRDSFCTGGSVGTNIIPYKKIQRAWIDSGDLIVNSLGRKLLGFSFCGNIVRYNPSRFEVDVYNADACKKLFLGNDDYKKIANFLEVAKTF